jgi:hypothetical protein
MKITVFTYGIAIICAALGAPRWVAVTLAVIGLAAAFVPELIR